MQMVLYITGGTVCDLRTFELGHSKNCCDCEPRLAMADPPSRAPCTPNAQRAISTEDLETTTALRIWGCICEESDQIYAAPASGEATNSKTSSGRATTKEIRQIIDHLQRTIDKQISPIQLQDRAEGSKHDQTELQGHYEKLQQEAQALRAQIDVLTAPTSTRSWAVVAADTNKPYP